MNNTSKFAAELGRRGGQKSAEKRLGGLTKQERSDLMRRVRLSKEEDASFRKGLTGMVDNLNKNATKE